MLTVILVVAAFFLAYGNGANDNFKGVATLYGSGILTYRTALYLATAATFAGSMLAIFLAQELVSSFSGKGLVPDAVSATPHFLIAVALGAGGTVLLASRLGFPISTTHALVGGLVGAAVLAVGQATDFSRLGEAFFLPLLASPFIAFSLGFVVYKAFNRTRQTLGLTKETCLCIGEPKRAYPVNALAGNRSLSVPAGTNAASRGAPAIMVEDYSDCVDLYTDRVLGLSLQRVLDGLHVISGAAVSLARGLNDTPKIAALLLVVPSLDLYGNMIVLALAMATGGLLNARRVAETMSHRITEISHGQGFSANLVTSLLVIVASKFGVPVSTTHVSVGAIFGISMVNERHSNAMIGSILLSWLITLPVAITISGLAYWLISLL